MWYIEPMNTYVALLRGINVGGRIVKMADLKSCFEMIGYHDVTTLLQTGNVVFSTPESDPVAIKAKIESCLTETFHYPARILLYSMDQLQKIVDSYPFDETDETYQHYVIFMGPGLAAEMIGEAVSTENEVERVALGSDVVYWQVQKGMTLHSPFAKLPTKKKFIENTNRNIKTVKKILALGDSKT